MFRRRKEQKTDYEKRLALLKSRKTRVVIKRNLKYINIQFIDFEKKGDRVVLEENSKKLSQYGWKGHCGNLPSAYLTGLMAGLGAINRGVKEAVLDIGLQGSVKGNSIYAAAIGVKDSGIKIEIGQQMPQARIEGKHISDYAKILKKDDMEKFRKQFSDYIKKGIDPEKTPEHFAQVRENIMKAVKSDKNA